MNPMALAATILHLKQNTRTCPKCGHRQIVAADRARQAVTCRHCGGSIPPKSS